MTSEHDRLLAQGPRIAPEAPMVADDGSAAVVPVPAPAPAVVADETEQSRPLRLPSSGAPSRGRPGLGRRLVPLLVGLGIAARAVGSGRYEGAAFAVVAVAVVTAILVRKARQL